MYLRRVASAASLALLSVACKPSARPLAVNVDACEVCRMVITDARFGGEVLLNTGRIRTFDSIECLANYVNAQSDTTTIHEILVSDVDHAELIPLADAVFAKGGPSTTPMGMGFVAHTRRHGLPAEQGTLSWEEVLRLVRDAPFGAPVSAPDSSAHALSQ